MSNSNKESSISALIDDPVSGNHHPIVKKKEDERESLASTTDQSNSVVDDDIEESHAQVNFCEQTANEMKQILDWYTQGESSGCGEPERGEGRNNADKETKDGQSNQGNLQLSPSTNSVQSPRDQRNLLDNALFNMDGDVNTLTRRTQDESSSSYNPPGKAKATSSSSSKQEASLSSPDNLNFNIVELKSPLPSDSVEVRQQNNRINELLEYTKYMAEVVEALSLDSDEEATGKHENKTVTDDMPVNCKNRASTREESSSNPPLEHDRATTRSQPTRSPLAEETPLPSEGGSKESSKISLRGDRSFRGQKKQMQRGHNISIPYLLVAISFLVLFAAIVISRLLSSMRGA